MDGDVLTATREEVKDLADSTDSTPDDVQFAPKAWTREGRTD